jgi:hypothetical protein
MEPEKNTMEVEKNTNVLSTEPVAGQISPMQPMEPVKDTSGKNFISILAVFCVLIVVVVGAAIGYLNTTKPKTDIVAQVAEVRKPEPTPTIAPLPLPQGPRIFKYSHGDDVVGPKPQEVRISTIDPGMNGKQKVSVDLTHNSPITDVAVNLTTDNKVARHQLTKITGDEFGGTWEGEWVVDDTYQTKYFLEFDLKSTTTSYKDGLTFR